MRSLSCSGSSDPGVAGPSLVFQDQVGRQALAAGAGSQTARMVTPVSPARRGRSTGISSGSGFAG